MIDHVCNQDPDVVNQDGKATIHTCRHTYISRMAMAGMSLHKVGQIVGHNNLETTAGYTHLAAVDVLSEARMRMGWNLESDT